MRAVATIACLFLAGCGDEIIVVGDGSGPSGSAAETSASGGSGAASGGTEQASGAGGADGTGAGGGAPAGPGGVVLLGERLTLAVASVAPDCDHVVPEPPFEYVCQNWYFYVEMPSALLVEGPIDLDSPEVDEGSLALGEPHEPRQFPGDCPSEVGALAGEIEITDVQPDYVDITFKSGFAFIDASGDYRLLRCD